MVQKQEDIGLVIDVTLQHIDADQELYTYRKEEWTEWDIEFLDILALIKSGAAPRKFENILRVAMDIFIEKSKATTSNIIYLFFLSPESACVCQHLSALPRWPF